MSVVVESARNWNWKINSDAHLGLVVAHKPKMAKAFGFSLIYENDW